MRCWWGRETPAGVESPIQWLLLTSVPVSSLADAMERIEWYRLRWQIEVYHKVLKSGCRVEQAQLATRERLLPYIALCSIIAFRLFWMTMVARHDPDAPATVVLADHEWQALYAFHHKTNRVPDQPPSVAQVTTWIAQLGGFFSQKRRLSWCHGHLAGVAASIRYRLLLAHFSLLPICG